MGNTNSSILIHVYTGDRRNSGTDAGVHVILHDAKNAASLPIKLSHFLRNNFEQNSVDTFSVPDAMISSLQSPVRISRIELWKNRQGLANDWFVDKIEVENKSTNERFVFPIFRWIKSNIHYQIKLLDTSLPQFDEFPEQRRQGLKDKKASYLLEQKIANGPVQSKTLPSDESFTFSYKWDITAKTSAFKIRRNIHLLFYSLNFTSLKDLESVYDGDIFKIPENHDKWDDDVRFGMQRVARLNYSLITLVKEIPKNFPVTDELLKPFLEGSTIHELINQKRLFICDFVILEGIPCKEGFQVCSPIGLFYLDSGNNLKPVAIQLFQVPGPDNPVFTPSSPKLTWAMVKLWFNNADTAYHQSLTHLGNTHLLMEGVTMTSHRHLSVSHPIFKIMAPHFLYVCAINHRAIAKLVSPGGWVDQIMNCASVGLFEIVSRGFQKWRMNVEGTLPEDLKNRGLDDTSILPVYHFRDDGLLVYNAIRKYVSSYVDLYYTSPEMLAEDYELQGWAQELVTEPGDSNEGLGLKGVPGNGKITTNEQLVIIVTSIIYTCSVAHASANFPQYDEYGYPPKYPAMMKGKPPTDPNAETTEQDIVKSLSNREELLKAMSLTKILSTKGTKSLGDFEVQYVFDSAALKLVDIFREDLQEISKKINERNKERAYPYEYMDPKFIPNSISI